MLKNIGHTITWLSEIDSTNRCFDEYTIAKPTHGEIVVTSNQTQGKGQGQNRWLSEKDKNIAMSLYIEPLFLSPDKPFYITMFTTLGLCDFLNNYITDVSIKWPNDIYHQHRKLVGILIENTMKGAQIASSVIGIGLNVNQLQFPSEIPNPTSLAMICKSSFSLQPLVDKVAENLDNRYSQFENMRFRDMKTEYLEKFYLLNETHEYQTIHGKMTGKIIDIQDSGELVFLRDGDASPLLFSFKEIEFPLIES